MPDRQVTPVSSHSRTRRLQLALASVGALVAISVPLTGTAASARVTAPRKAAATGSPAAQSTGPKLPAARAAYSSAKRVGKQATTGCPWLNTALPVGKRVNMLISAMSLSDKIAEMYINEPTTTGPYAGYEGYVPAQPALCIPDLVEQDGSLGVAYGATDVTQLPSEISLASAWDPTLAYQYGAVNGAEHRAKGIGVVLGLSLIHI